MGRGDWGMRGGIGKERGIIGKEQGGVGGGKARWGSVDWNWEGARGRGSESEVRKVRVRCYDC